LASLLYRSAQKLSASGGFASLTPPGALPLDTDGGSVHIPPYRFALHTFNVVHYLLVNPGSAPGLSEPGNDVGECHILRAL